MDERWSNVPDAVYSVLLSRGGRAERRRALAAIHDFCRSEQDAGRPVTLERVGQMLEAQGLLKSRALFNAQSRDYRALIIAWGLRGEGFESLAVAADATGAACRTAQPAVTEHTLLRRRLDLCEELILTLLA